MTRPTLTVALRNFAEPAPKDWRHLLMQARVADEVGLDRVFVSDHVAFGPDLSDYGAPERGGAKGGQQPTSPDGDWIEALTAITAMAAVTERLRLGTNVLVSPLRPAALVAKVASSIDVLSHGRFDLGVGIGWQEAEYRACGVDYSKRGRILDEQLEAWHQLWTQDAATLVTDRFSLEGIHMMPKPTDPAGVPVWIGGRARPEVARRLARYGTGWIPWGTTPDDFLTAVASMRGLIAAEGADPARITIGYALPHAVSGGTIDHDTLFAEVPRMIDNGVTDFRSLLRVPQDEEGARAMLGGLVDRFARIAG